MRVARVVLQNVKSYSSATTIDLAPGVNAICGENGAGKSTILEAIGFALFGYRPYRLDAFLRGGEKSGNVTVTVEDDDGCVFKVVRKLGSGSGQAVYNELEQRIAEGETDVRNWLLDFFSLEPGTDLAKLFEDTVGPPQGTLTAIFLEAAAPKAKKFDRLLGIEDYPAAAQGLKAVSNLFRDEGVEYARVAALLEGDARRLPEMEQRRDVLVLRKSELASELIRLVAGQSAMTVQREELEKRRQEVQSAQSALEVAEGRVQEARRRQEELDGELARAEGAVRAVEASRPGYVAHRKAVDLLRQLDERRLERDRLRQAAETAGRNAVKWEQGVRALEERLGALARDEARAGELDLLVPEQEMRERAVENARERVRAREEAARQIPGVEERLATARAALSGAREQLAQVEIARPVAAGLEGMRQRQFALLDEAAQLEKGVWALHQAAEELTVVERRLRQLDEESGLCEGEIAALLDLRPLAILAAERQRARDVLSAEILGLEARRQEAVRTRGQVEGGLCPFLHEPCRNLRPGVSLDAHFDRLIAETSSGRERAGSALALSEMELAQSRTAEKSLSRLPDLQQRAARIAEERDQRLMEIDGLRQRSTELAETPDTLARVKEVLRVLEPELAATEAARTIVAGEPGWRRQAEEAALALERDDRILTEIRAVLEREAGAAEALEVAGRDLAGMKDPRGQATLLRHRIARERPEAERALERGRRESAVARTAEESARHALEPFASLEDEIATAAARRDENEAAHRAFLANQGEAERLPQRRVAFETAVAESKAAEDALESARRLLATAQASYDGAALLRLQIELDRVAGEIGRARGEAELRDRDLERVSGELEGLRAAKAGMETAMRQAEESRRLMGGVEAVRRALDNAGPEIARRLVRRVSDRATNLYRELLGQPSLSLEWGSDYEIRCRVKAEEREFKQLSGGEQMAAALAVRLALLQTLSNLKLAFLDEPTAHMDAARRSNLAAQIQNLRSFDQLVVISHDDSFDTLFGHVVRLAKRDGATVVEE